MAAIPSAKSASLTVKREGAGLLNDAASAACVAAAGAHEGAVLSAALPGAKGDVIGTLNVYLAGSARPSETDRAILSAIASQTAAAVELAFALNSTEQLNENLRIAVAHREVIGEAKGILMAQQNCTRAQSFDILRRVSQRENRKLRSVAEDLVERVESRAGPRSGHPIRP